jgi:EAL domain-containing protein (putative c-di-GMP-specific phosphodiesterase class I)
MTAAWPRGCGLGDRASTRTSWTRGRIAETALHKSPSQHLGRATRVQALPSKGIDFEFSFAFQPIVDASTREIISFEALVRGPHGESAAEVFAGVARRDLFRFDQACRLKAIRLARRLNLNTALNLNLFPISDGQAGTCLEFTLDASLRAGFPVERLVFEVSETEQLRHNGRVGGIFEGHPDCGFRTAIDDFGTGFSGLRMLVEFQPNYVKLDRSLVADIHEDGVKQVILKGIRSICRQLSITPVAEGVEKAEEYHWLQEAGINIFQGYYFARPSFEALAEVRPALFN